MVGKEEYTTRHRFLGKLSSYELIFNFSGHVTAYFGQDVLENLPGTIRYLPKGDISRYEIDIKEPGECIAIYFDTDKPISERAFIANVQRKENIGNLFKKIFSKWVGRGEGFYFECLSILYRIFALMQKNEYLPERHRLKIKPAVDKIFESFLKEDFTTEGLASLCNMSESYFKRLFKRKYGVSPKRYVIQLKINHACDLLRLERYTVTEIAAMCNFSDVYFFSRQFKDYMGISPTEFVRKCKSSK